MARIFECDVCKKQTTEPLRVWITFERTPEEIKELMAANDAPLGAEEKMKKISIVTKPLDLCRECYDKLKGEYLS